MCINNWIILNECKNQMVAKINAEFDQFMYLHGCDHFTGDAGKESYRHRESRPSQEKDVLAIVRQELSTFVNPATFPLLFYYLDRECTLLEVMGDKQEKTQLSASQIGIGFRFTAANTGIHSITLCASSGDSVVIISKEHHLPLFHHRISLCRPIVVTKKRVGYLAMSYCAEQKDGFFAKMMMDMVATRIMKRIEAHFRFKSYQLTTREEEVALQWMRSESITNIATRLCITEGTAKNYVKRIYKKTGVRSKGEFILKLLDMYEGNVELLSHQYPSAKSRIMS